MSIVVAGIEKEKKKKKIVIKINFQLIEAENVSCIV